MTTDVASWEGAEAIARAHVGGEVTRRPGGPPYLFWVKGRRGVLVHRGAVITTRGLETAVSYFRDIGVVAGDQAVDDLLYALYVLEAMPEVDGFGEDSYVYSDAPERLKELRARIDREPGRATIVLHYLGDAGSGWVEAGSPSAPEADLRAVIRMSLVIAEDTPATWAREDITWVYPKD